ncbi:c-type cytochrome [candidate division KSB1 bacterium]
MKNKSLLKRIAILCIPIIVLCSCSGNQTEEKKTTNETSTEVQTSKDILIEESEKQESVADKQELPSVKEIAIDLALGEQIYMEKCIVCHQADGKGIPGAFPPLANSDFLIKDKIKGAIQVLKGSHKKMIVNGKTFNGKMPPQVSTKEEAVAVINYVLNNFGNDLGTISLDEVVFKLEDEKEVNDIPFNTKDIADSLN